MTQSKPLSLKKPLSFIQEAKLYQSLGIKLKNKEKKQQKNKKVSTQYLKKKRLRQAVDWLSCTYPKCFNPQDPKPLKIGISKDIILEGQWPHSKKFLKKTLAFYVGSPFYQRALIKGKNRVSLIGKEIDQVTDLQEVDSKERLNKLKKEKT